MKTAMGIIFSNVYDSNMGGLTEARTSAAIPFAGRYRQIDFALSNMANAMIHHIGIVTKYNYESLMNHIGSCEEWDLEMEQRGVVLLPPFATGHMGVYRGKLEALYTALDVLEHSSQDYVVLTDTTVLAAVDYAAALQAHIDSGCDITVIAKPDKADGKRVNTLSMKLDQNGKPIDMTVDFAAPKEYLVSMGMFVISRELLIRIIRETAPHGKYHLERDFIMDGFINGTVSVNVFRFEGVTLFNGSVQEYYENSMALMDEATRHGLFRTDIPIYTKPRDEVPTVYGEGAQITDSLVADGSYLDGCCKHSVLFREITLERGARLDGCVVMQGCKIGTGADLQCVILDKDVVVRPYVRLVGTPEHPLYVRKGDTV